MIEAKMKTTLLAKAMICGYANHYPSETFAVEAVEEEFATKIRNPETQAESRSFTLAGKVDGLVRRDGALWLLEHKTAASIDGAYIDKLWMDFQTTLYANAVETVRGEPVAGVIYNVIAKAGLRPYEAGKKRETDETGDEFAARLAEWYTKPGAYHREELLISADRATEVHQLIWDLTQSMLDAKRRGIHGFYHNTRQCFQFNRPCAYWPICRSNDNPNVVENDYRHADPHSELAPVENGNGKTRTTYSMWADFADCRRRFYWRHEQQIVPVREETEALYLGSVVHTALAEWHKSRDLAAALSVIDAETKSGAAEPLAF
jgi:hypothetical protein